MVHIKRVDEMLDKSVSRVRVNGSANGRNEYEVKIAQEFTGAEYLFTVYADDEAQAIDLVLDLVSKRYKELVANVPSNFSNDWGHDDEGGYTAYGDDSPYVFNSEGTVAVNAEGFEITERKGRMTEGRISRRGGGKSRLNESAGGARKTDAIGFRDEAKAAFARGDMDAAAEAWGRIYDLYGDNSSESFMELNDIMGGFTDDEVYGITDYMKKKMGY